MAGGYGVAVDYEGPRSGGKSFATTYITANTVETPISMLLWMRRFCAPWIWPANRVGRRGC
jgi:hypothetical protein